MPPRPIYFRSPKELRDRLERHGTTEKEVIVGYWRKATGEPSLTWQESVDEALCFGWIDGIRRTVDEQRYTVRFTPRTSTSTWSAVNIARAKALIAEGRMRPAGLRAFEARADERAATHAAEQRRSAALAPAEERAFRANAKAWRAFAEMAPSYRRLAIHWVTSAKKDGTRARRLATLIADSAAGRKIAPMRRP